MVFRENAITDSSIFDDKDNSADLLRRNMQSNKIYSIDDIVDLKRSQNANSHSI
jgi:hypothetical protein